MKLLFRKCYLIGIATGVVEEGVIWRRNPNGIYVPIQDCIGSLCVCV